MEVLTGVDYVIYAATVFATAIFSGIAGAGGGFILTPLLIFLGATPAQAVSSGKFSGLAVSIGSLAGLRRVRLQSRKSAAIVMCIALIAGLFAPFVIVALDTEIYKTILGILLLTLIPVLYIKKVGHKKTNTSKNKRLSGYALVGFSLWLQGIFSGGLGTLVNISLMGLLGMSALEANVVKRYSQVILNTTIVFGVLGSGLILWKVALIGVVMSGIGGYIGGKLAFKSGDVFVMNVFMAFMFLAGLALIIG